jgi:hypothetical protein
MGCMGVLWRGEGGVLQGMMNRGFYAKFLHLDIKIMQDLSEGEILYKYVPAERKDYLDENHQLLRFIQSGAFNDPFECCPGLSLEEAENISQRHREQNQ